MRAPIPDLPDDARRAALARAVAARQLRAGVRGEIKDGTRSLRDVMLAGQRDDEEGRILARMKVVDLLCALPHIGPVRASGIMSKVGIATNRRVGGLGNRQIDELTEYFENR